MRRAPSCDVFVMACPLPVGITVPEKRDSAPGRCIALQFANPIGDSLKKE
jgi:hypothetical protein